MSERKYPRYNPNSATHEGIQGLYEHLVDEARALVHTEQYAASGVIWSMLEEVSCIIADANGITCRVKELTDEVSRLNDVIGDMKRDQCGCLK